MPSPAVWKVYLGLLISASGGAIFLLGLMLAAYPAVSGDSPEAQVTILQELSQYVLTATLTVAITTLVGLFAIAIALIELERKKIDLGSGLAALRFATVRPFTQMAGYTALLSIMGAAGFQISLSIDIQASVPGLAIFALAALGILLWAILFQIIILISLLQTFLGVSEILTKRKPES